MRVLGLAEDRGAVPSTTQGLRTIHNFSFSEPDAFFLPPWVPGMHRVDTDTWRQIPCAYKIKQINVIKVYFFKGKCLSVKMEVTFWDKQTYLKNCKSGQ